MGVKWTPGPWQIRSTVDPMTNPTERNLERVRGICDAWRNAGQPWGETRNEAEDIHKRYEPRFVIVYALAMDELEREAEQRGAERERERADEAERLLRLLCARINGDQDKSLEGMRACQSPELADISISIELAYKRAIRARGGS